MQLYGGLHGVQHHRVRRAAVLLGQGELAGEHPPHQLQQQGLLAGIGPEEGAGGHPRRPGDLRRGRPLIALLQKQRHRPPQHLLLGQQPAGAFSFGGHGIYLLCANRVSDVVSMVTV